MSVLGISPFDTLADSPHGVIHLVDRLHTRALNLAHVGWSAVVRPVEQPSKTLVQATQTEWFVQSETHCGLLEPLVLTFRVGSRSR